MTIPVHDLRSFIKTVSELSARELLTIDEPLSGHWQLAGITTELVNKMRMPVIRYSNVEGSAMPVIHNVCASLTRIGKSMGWTVPELENRLAMAYDNLISFEDVETGPVRDNAMTGDSVDLSILPAIRYTETETHPYLSAAHVVAYDPVSKAMNISFHRMMIIGKNTLTVYMTPGGHLDTIFQHNAREGRNTPLAVFLGVHPLHSLGSLAAGSLALDEFSVIGGLLGYPLPVVKGLIDQRLRVPAYSEIVLEGELSCTTEREEGPYGEAFGFVSDVSTRPVLTVQLISHRDDPLFQDIVPGQLEHLTMTGVSTQVHLKKTLLEKYSCITDVHLPTPMTVYIGVSVDIGQWGGGDILRDILTSQRFVKQVVLFDDEVDISNAKQTQNAMAMHVQADRDVVTLSGLPGNGLDPSEINNKTAKWGVDASSYAKHGEMLVKNKIPKPILDSLDIKAILERARKAEK